MERIISREQLAKLLTSHRLSEKASYRPSMSARIRGSVFNNIGNWGRDAEGSAAVGIIKPDAIEQYIILGTGTIKSPAAEVNLVDVLNWASTPDPTLAKRINDLEKHDSALMQVVQAHAKRDLATSEEDPALTWPIFTSDDGYGDDYQLRCMADVPTGRIFPGGKPQMRDCRAPIDGDSITEILASLRIHIEQVEHVLPEKAGSE
jgi:hypothetical protein